VAKLVATGFQGTSRKTIRHALSLIHAKGFKRYDQGKEMNIKLYGSVTAPDYDLTLNKVPVALLLGKNDTITPLKDNQWTRAQYEKAGTLKFYQEYYFGHFLFGIAKSPEHVIDTERHLMKYSQ
jgi:hypothetical protein